MLTVTIIENKTVYSVHVLHLFLCLFSLAIFISSNFPVHATISLSTNFLFLFFIQFSQSKYSPTSHDLSYSHSQLLGLQINPLSHTPLSINSLHSHLHLSSFQHCLLLQTLASNLHSHLHVSCHSLCLVSLVLYITLNTLTFKFFAISGTHILHRDY